jgi:hypothetical protein
MSPNVITHGSSYGIAHNATFDEMDSKPDARAYVTHE